MPFINPAFSELRRLHQVYEQCMIDYKDAFKSHQRIDAITIVKYMLPTGKERWIVTDGTHRTQAALELGLPEIEYRLATVAQAAQVATKRGWNFDDLAQRAVPFRVGVHSFSPY